MSFSHSTLPAMEQLVECPYNKAHMVVKHRLPKHLMKCRLSHSSAGTKECRFNASHIHPIEEIRIHEESCSDRLMVEMYMISKCNEEEGNMLPESSISSSDQQNDEDWDVSVPSRSYNPKLKCNSGNTLVHVQHGTPTMREMKRREIRKRHEESQKVESQA